MSSRRDILLARKAALEDELAHDSFSTACIELQEVIGELRGLENAGNNSARCNLGGDFNSRELLPLQRVLI